MTPADVTRWLKDIGESRKWLADQADVSARTLNNQFSLGRFSKRVEVVIKQLMAEQREPRVRFTPEQWDVVEQARRAAGYSDREAFFVDAILHYSDGILRQRQALRAAEGSRPYRPKPPPPES